MKAKVIDYAPERGLLEVMITSLEGTVEREFDLPALEYILNKMKRDVTYIDKISLDEYEYGFIKQVYESGGYRWLEDKLDGFVQDIF